MKADVCAEKRSGNIVFGGQIIAACRIARAVAARFARFAFFDNVENRVNDIAVFARVADEIKTETGNANLRIGFEQIFDQKTLNVDKAERLQNGIGRKEYFGFSC